MANNIVIREGKKEDCVEISRLIKELAHFEKMPNSVRVDAKTLERDGFDMDPPLYYSLVVEDPNQNETENPKKLIGYAIYYFGYSTWNGKKFYLEDIMITEKFRGKGVGKLLFRRICQEAVKHDCQVMNFTVLAWNPAVKFYKLYGCEDLTISKAWHFWTLEKPNFEKASQEIK